MQMQGRAVESQPAFCRRRRRKRGERQLTGQLWLHVSAWPVTATDSAGAARERCAAGERWSGPRSPRQRQHESSKRRESPGSSAVGCSADREPEARPLSASPGVLDRRGPRRRTPWDGLAATEHTRQCTAVWFRRREATAELMCVLTAAWFRCPRGLGLLRNQAGPSAEEAPRRRGRLGRRDRGAPDCEKAACCVVVIAVNGSERRVSDGVPCSQRSADPHLLRSD